jgi:hypothetical protein
MEDYYTHAAATPIIPVHKSGLVLAGVVGVPHDACSVSVATFAFRTVFSINKLPKR